MSILLNNKSDFILEYNESCGGELKRGDVDWTQSRVIFVSTNYTEYQKHSVNFKDVPFELWEIKQFENNLIGISQHKNNSEESISKVSNNPENIVSKVSKQVKMYNEEYHLNSSKTRKSWVNELYFSMKERILNLGEVEIKYTSQYVSFRQNSPFVDLIMYNSGIYTVINMKDGELNDPDKKCTRYEGKGHWGSGDYYILVDKKTDLDYVMFLIKQKYNNLPI
jgi:predicted transport protein